MAIMTIIFRTDASQQIGSGHVMRCLTLANELRQRGADVMFVCREHPGHLIGLIEGKGYPVVRLRQPEVEYDAAPEDVAHAAWLGVSWEAGRGRYHCSNERYTTTVADCRPLRP